MRLSKEQVALYHKQGFLILPNVFDDDELKPVIQHIERLIDLIANNLVSEGKISDAFANDDFLTRLNKIAEQYPRASVMATLRMKISSEVFELWKHPKLLAIISSLIGEDIDGHPFWGLRAKTRSEELLNVPWHQDCAYLKQGGSNTFQPTIWLPLLDANDKNGCLQVIPCGHAEGKELPHVAQSITGDSDSWYLEIPSEHIDELAAVTCEVPKGGAILFNQLLPHRSLNNSTEQTRWSLDFRYMKKGMFSGTNQNSIPFTRKEAEALSEVELKQLEYLTQYQENYEESSLITSLHTMSWLDRWR